VTVTVRLPGYRTPESQQVTISAPSVGTVVLPWWPDEIATSNIAGVYETQERPGRSPLLLRSGDSLYEMRVGCIVTVADVETSDHTVAQVLDALATMATIDSPVTVKLANRSGRYRVTDLGITELDWDKAGSVLSAEVSMTLVVASEAVIPVGPIKKKPRPGRGGNGGGGNGGGKDKPAHGGPNKPKRDRGGGGGPGLTRVD
jgi:hypothetical protein